MSYKLNIILFVETLLYKVQRCHLGISEGQHKFISINTDCTVKWLMRFFWSCLCLFQMILCWESKTFHGTMMRRTVLYNTVPYRSILKMNLSPCWSHVEHNVLTRHPNKKWSIWSLFACNDPGSKILAFESNDNF